RVLFRSMAGKTAILSIRILSDSRDAKKGMEQTATAAQRLESGLDRMTPAATGALLAVGALGKKAFDAASDLQQSTGAVTSVFGEQADAVRQYAAGAAESVGLAKSQYQDLAAVLGSQLKNLGLPMENVAGQTQDLIGLGSDLAATFGGSTSDAVAALSSLLRGERDPIEQYGVSIKQADINAQMAKMGLQ